MNYSRIKRVVENMNRCGFSQMIVASTHSIYYLTGIWIVPHERMYSLYIRDDGSVSMFTNEIFDIKGSAEMPVITHKDGENPVAALAAVVKPGKIGIDKFWFSKFLIGLMEARPDIQPVQGSAPVDIARQCKDTEERDAMRTSSRINDIVMSTIISEIRPGVSENDLISRINRLFMENGADYEGMQLACFGSNGADPHHLGDNTVIKPGDCVTFDIFSPIKRYWCDMTRTVFFGSVTKKQREVYEIVREANEAAEAIAAPGVLLSDLDKAARDVISRAGYGQYFTHRLGHGCGLECHEPPDVGGMSDVAAEPGMVFSVEPGIYLPGEFGIRIEDLVMITENGSEVLNGYTKDLQVVGL